MSNPNQICFEPEAGDTNSFGSSVAINDKYLAVGDPYANRVVIYLKDLQGQWRRNREIYPPENYEVGNSFGASIITLDRSTLMIDSVTGLPAKYFNNPDNFTVRSNSSSIFFGQYFIDLDREHEATPIYFPAEKVEGFVQFYILSEGKLKLVMIPDNNEELFGVSTAVHNNLLLVGSPSRSIGGKGWLFDLIALDNKPIELTIENAYLGDTVAISGQFAVVGNSGSKKFSQDYISQPKTLIRSIKNGSTVIINSQGKLSLDGNILAVMLPSLRRFLRGTSLLKVFRLDEDATPNLILERKYSKLEKKHLARAWMQNGWLITVYRIDRMGSVKLCIESIQKTISE
jgi:hypothetical protein